KLATPVQYEPALEGLNDIRPLQLADENKIVLSCPVLCKNPPSTGKPTVGMFARSSQQGALLTANNKVCTAYEYIEQDFEYGLPNKVIHFSQKVSFVQSRVIIIGVWTGAWWITFGLPKIIMDIYNYSTNFLPFAGIDLRIRVGVTIPDTITRLGFWGFY
ncbi:unnamed protein product, partial [marine sediment metagenome]